MITDFRLKVFKTVADRLSFTKAAAELLISQPAVTRHISELEKQLGVPLFDRCRGNVSLTAHGKLMLDYANRILAIYADLNDTFADDAGRPAGNFRWGRTYSSITVPRILLRLHVTWTLSLTWWGATRSHVPTAWYGPEAGL